MTTDLATTQDSAELMGKVLIEGDLKSLQPGERIGYYKVVCESLELNPYTKPFEFITLNGKLTLYATKNCTDQLRGKRQVSVTKLEREQIGELYVVTAYATDKSGRSDSSIGAVNIKGLSGESLANALMKAETKAKRRVTLSLCGLGFADESEISSIPSAQVTVVDHTTGEITGPAPAAQGEVAKTFDASVAHAVCDDCERFILQKNGDVITLEQSRELAASFEGRVLCQTCRPFQPQRKRPAA